MEKKAEQFEPRYPYEKWMIYKYEHSLSLTLGGHICESICNMDFIGAVASWEETWRNKDTDESVYDLILLFDVGIAVNIYLKKQPAPGCTYELEKCKVLQHGNIKDFGEILLPANTDKTTLRLQTKDGEIILVKNPL